MEAIIPVIVLAGIAIYAFSAVPNLTTATGLQALLRHLGEFGLVCIGMTLVLVSGGIDISVGAAYGLSAMLTLIFLKLLGLPLLVGLIAVVVCGALMGVVNGTIVAYLKARPILVTLVTLIVFRGILNLLDVNYTAELARIEISGFAWEFLGDGFVAGVPTSTVILAIVAVVGHLLLSRGRYGWHVTSVGGARRAARHAGINVERTLLTTYVAAGALAGLSGALFAARLESAGTRTGEGLEFLVLTAVVVGGVSLFGGSGTVPRAIIGALIVLLLSRALLLQNYDASIQNMVLGIVLLASVGFDRKFTKNRLKIIQKLYISPVRRTYLPLPPMTGPYEVNRRLEGADAIGLDRVEGPEDVILDEQGRLYTGTRMGEVLRFSGPNLENQEVFSRIGGRPVGMGMDAKGNIIDCVCGMGLYTISPDGAATLLTDRTRRTFFRIYDDSRIRVADDVDVAPDGRIYFSDFSTRYESADWLVDCFEGRHNGRLLCYDPSSRKTTTVLNRLLAPNGVAICHDGESLLVNQTWACNVLRYWFAGPDEGRLEEFCTLPGYPDNVNRSSDGGYWIALAGVRSPAFDLLMAKPRVRRRMVNRLPSHEWLFPSMNTGAIIKVNQAGEPVLSFWDAKGEAHPVITSMREYDGHLYIAGLENNRVGRIKLTPEEQHACRPGQVSSRVP